MLRMKGEYYSPLFLILFDAVARGPDVVQGLGQGCQEVAAPLTDRLAWGRDEAGAVKL